MSKCWTIILSFSIIKDSNEIKCYFYEDLIWKIQRALQSESTLFLDKFNWAVCVWLEPFQLVLELHYLSFRFHASQVHNSLGLHRQVWYWVIRPWKIHWALEPEKNDKLKCFNFRWYEASSERLSSVFCCCCYSCTC